MWKKEKKYVYTWLGHFAVQQKLTDHCNSRVIKKILLNKESYVLASLHELFSEPCAVQVCPESCTPWRHPPDVVLCRMVISSQTLRPGPSLKCKHASTRLRHLISICDGTSPVWASLSKVHSFLPISPLFTCWLFLEQTSLSALHCS